LVNQVVRLFLVGEKTESKLASLGDERRGFFDGQVRLTQKIHHQIDYHLQPPDLAVFLEDFRLGGHGKNLPDVSLKFNWPWGAGI
jgi:hypothetical protein